SVLEPYGSSPAIAAVRRLPLRTAEGQAFPDSFAAAELCLSDGRFDLFIAADAENPLSLTPSLAASKTIVQKEWGAALTGELAWVRRSGAGEIERAVLCRAEALRVGDLAVRLDGQPEFVEITIRNGKAVLVSGKPDAVREITLKGQPIWDR
ncbi:MAG: hypothetical protein IT210_07415, partial [Armatimonadetes bacterium]|nr:hypothetical protein [Armatimonadota bacterium]